MYARSGILAFTLKAIVMTVVSMLGIVGASLPAAASSYVKITSPGTGATVRGTITIATAESSDVSWINVFVDKVWVASNPSTAVPPYKVSWNSTTVADGNHTISVTGYSSSNSPIASAAAAIKVRNHVPTPTPTPSAYVRITTPPAGAVVHGTITLGTSESPNVSWVNFYVDSKWLASNPSSAAPPYSISWNSASVADGTHTLSVNGCNSASIVIASAKVTISVKNTISPTATPRPPATPTPLKPTPTRSPKSTATPRPTVKPTAAPSLKPTPAPSRKPAATPSASPSPAASISITSPGSGAAVHGIVTVATAESANVSWVNFYVDNVWFASNPSTASPPYAVNWNSTSVADGTHTLSVNAYNPSNAVIAAAKVAIAVHNLAGSPTPTAAPSPRPSSSPKPSIAPTPAPTGVASYPLSDAAAAAKVTLNPGFEPRPGNYKPNHAVPNAGELALVGNLSWLDAHGNGLLAKATGNYTGTTDEILQWAAYKWGFDPDITRANAVTETHWNQYDIGDVGNGVSLGILQIKSRDYNGTCNPVSRNGFNTGFVTDPSCLSYNYTGFAADYKLAYQRACMDGSITYLYSQTPVSGYPAYANATGSARLWGCIGDWFSGNWYDSGAINYIKDVQNNLANKAWLQPGF